MSRLPTPGGDSGAWGNILNDFLGQALTADGTIKAAAVGPTQVQDGSLPKAKLDSSVQASLAKADTALQTAPVTSVVGQTGAVTGTQIAADATVSSTYSPRVEAVNAVTNAGAGQTLPDPSVQSVSRLTLTQNCTLTLPTATAGKSFTLVLVQGGSGSYTISCAAAKWPGGIVPVISTAVGAVDYLSFVCVDGATWAGFVAGLDVK